VGVPMEHEEAFDIDKMVVHVNWADLVNRLTSSPSYFRIELRIAKTEKAKKLDVLHNKPEEIADFFRVYGTRSLRKGLLKPSCLALRLNLRLIKFQFFFFFAKIECGLYFLDRFDVLMSKIIFKK
jgi:hypothetical protein